MKRFVSSYLAAGLLALSVPMSASAQTSIFASVGASFPASDWADYAETGWLAQAGVGFPLGAGSVSVGAGGFYGMNTHSDVEGDKTNLYGGSAYVQYSIRSTSSASGYIFGGPAYLTHSYKSDTFPEDSASGLAAEVGAGVDIPVGGATAYFEGMYLTSISDAIDGTDIFVASVGLSFSLGG